MQRRGFLRALPLAAGASLIASCFARAAEWQSTRLRDHPLVGRIWDAKRKRFVSTADLIEGLEGATFTLLGEVHDNADHHALQAELLQGVATAGVRRGVVFEQFDREFEPALQQLLASAKPGPDDVADAVAFDRNGWNWGFYRPLVAIALAHRLPIAAGNLSRKAAATIARKGLGVLDAERIAALRLDAGWSDAQEQALRTIVADGHCGALPVSVLPAMAAAQRVRDATLAEAMLGVAGEGAVLIAGNGHVRRDLAVPVYLGAAAPEKQCCAVGIIEVQEGSDDPAHYYASGGTRVRPFDYVCFTPRRDRPDPCEAFRRGTSRQ